MDSSYWALNNREIAIIIWISIFLIWTLLKPSIRKSFIELLKAFFLKKIIISTILMFLYISFMVGLTYQMGFWKPSQIKNTIIWTLFVAFLMLANINKFSEDEIFFRKTVLDNFKLIIFLEFILNFYVFNIVIEIILFPIMVLLVTTLAFAETDPKNKQVETVLNAILIILGIIFLLIAVYNIYSNYKSFLTVDNLRDFLLPPIFSIMFLPFIYLMALYVRYEILFMRLGFFIEDPVVRRYAKIKFLFSFQFNLKRLKNWSRRLTGGQIKNKEDVLKTIRNFKANL